MEMDWSLDNILNVIVPVGLIAICMCCVYYVCRCLCDEKTSKRKSRHESMTSVKVDKNTSHNYSHKYSHDYIKIRSETEVVELALTHGTVLWANKEEVKLCKKTLDMVI